MHSHIVIIMLAVGLVALTGVILSFLGMAGVLPGSRPAGGEAWDNPYLFGFIASIAVLAVDIVLAGLAFVWAHDPTHIAAPGLAALLLVVVDKWLRRVYGTSLLGRWRAPAAPAVGGPFDLETHWLDRVEGEIGHTLTAIETHKPWWLSKTLLVNALVGGLLLAESNISSLQGLLPANTYQIAAFALPIVNMMLRVYTTKGLSLKAAAQLGAAQ